MAHFSRGRYIVAFEADKGIPLLKDKKDDTYQPVFTDIMEFQKFNRENRFRTAVIPAEKIPDLLAPETKGVTINPMTVNLQLQIRKKEKLIPCFTYKRKGVCAYDESYYYYHWQTVWKRRA